MLTMGWEKEFELLLEQAQLEIERDLSLDLHLKTNTLVKTLPEEQVTCELEKKTKLRVVLDGNFLVRVLDKHIRHATELKLRKQIAQQDETISPLAIMIDSLFEQ